MSRLARALLRPEIDRDAIDDAAARRGWQLVNVLPGDAQRPAQLIFGAPGAALYVVDDRRLGVTYLQAEGAGAETLIEEARQELACRGPREAASLCASNDGSDRAAGLALLVLAHDAESEAFELLSAALGSADPALRRLAVAASAYVLWPDLRPSIEHLATRDPDPVLRAAAAAWLAAVPPPP